MSDLVVDASVAVKWVVEEDGSPHAVEILQRHRLSAPDLIIPECANILWKKVRRGELTTDEAAVAAHLLQRADLEIVPMRPLMVAALDLALELDHAAYDCIYLAVAIETGRPFATADDRLRRKLAGVAKPPSRPLMLSIAEAARL